MKCHTVISEYLHHLLLQFHVVSNKEALHHFLGCLWMCSCMERLGCITSGIPLEQVTAAWRLSSASCIILILLSKCVTHHIRNNELERICKELLYLTVYNYYSIAWRHPVQPKKKKKYQNNLFLTKIPDSSLEPPEEEVEKLMTTLQCKQDISTCKLNFLRGGTYLKSWTS